MKRVLLTGLPLGATSAFAPITSGGRGAGAAPPGKSSCPTELLPTTR
jgi:hypothetical protein